MRKYRPLPIVIAYTLFTFLTGLNFLTGSLGVLVALQVMSHAFGGAGEAIEVTSLSEWWSKERRGFALGLHHTGYPWGTLIGGLAISALLNAYGPENWRLAFLLFPVPMIIIFSVYWWFSTKKRYESFVEHAQAVGETPPAKEAVQGVVEVPKGAFKSAMKNPNISAIALISMFAIVGYFGISFWLPQYLAFVAHYNFFRVACGGHVPLQILIRQPDLAYRDSIVCWVRNERALHVAVCHCVRFCKARHDWPCRFNCQRRYLRRWLRAFRDRDVHRRWWWL
jgi:sugar phosphate permease